MGQRHISLMERLAHAGCRFEFNGETFRVLHDERSAKVLKDHYPKETRYWLEGENGESWVQLWKTEALRPSKP